MHSSKREYCMQYSQPLIMNVDHQCRKQSLLHQIYWNILGSKPCVDSEDQGLKLATGSFTMGFSSERGLLKKKKKSSGQTCIVSSGQIIKCSDFIQSVRLEVAPQSCRVCLLHVYVYLKPHSQLCASFSYSSGTY